jgi:asparagine synthase (glutamine-hydrolysing)
MCGIAGWIGTTGKSKSDLQQIGTLFSELLAHRGPDGFGIEVFKQGDGSVSPETGKAMLVHRRLSILGLGDAGAQPMVSASGRFAISFNGEIYNYIELAQKYEVDYPSSTDTEVLLQLWERFGSRILSELDGFFAFAVWDGEEETITLVRDRTGVKPLYYVEYGQSLWFASEDYALSAVLHEQGMEMAVDKEALLSHLNRSDSDSTNLFHPLKTLEAGCQLVWGRGQLIENRTWHDGAYIQLHDETAWVSRMGLKQSPKTYSELLREQLKFSMKRRLRSDVPLGFAVSGGVDSAALVTVARELMGKEAHLHVFSVVSPGSAADESEYQRLVVESVGGIWHKIDVSELDAHDLERYVRATHRIPVAWNNLAHFALCEKVRATGVKVLFNGQGADEIFGGYPHYYKAAFWSERGRLWPVRDRWPIAFSQAGKQWLKSMLGVFRGQVPESCVDRLMRADYYGPRLNQLLRFEDRNGMACGLESRNPFADDGVLADAWLNAWADDTWSLEGSLSSKLVDGYSKGYLRKAMQGLVPEPVLWRTDKKGFTVPSGRLTLMSLDVWEKWVLSERLDPLVRRGQRLSVLARARKIASALKEKEANGELANPTIQQEDLLSQIFRWAAVACFLETFQLKTHP